MRKFVFAQILHRHGTSEKTSKLTMDSISFFMPATSVTRLRTKGKGSPSSLSAKVLFHLGSPKQELRVHAWCQQMKSDSRKSKTFGTTMNVMESQFRSQLQQGAHTKVAGSWNQVQLLPVHFFCLRSKVAEGPRRARLKVPIIRRNFIMPANT